MASVIQLQGSCHSCGDTVTVRLSQLRRYSYSEVVMSAVIQLQ